MDQQLLLIPGPSPVVPSILQALARPTVSHVSADLADDMNPALATLKQVVRSSSGEPFVFAGAGTLAMEVALLNVVGRSDRVLVLSQGYFGDRMGQIAEAFGLDFDILRSPWGAAFRPEELLAALERGRYDVLAVTHVDTSTGACAPVRAYAEILRGRGLTYIVDGVCATGGLEENMDDWGIDVVLTAAQKALGAPPGLAIDVFSEKAMAKRRSLPSVPAYYSDVLRWLPVMKDPRKYFSTHCVNEIRAFAQAMRIIEEEGMEARIARHFQISDAIRAGLAALGFGLFTAEEFRAPTLSVVLYPDGVDDLAFRTAYAGNGCVVAGGLGETAGKVFRMGHMGNLSVEQAIFALEAMERTLRSIGRAVEPGLAVRAAEGVLGR